MKRQNDVICMGLCSVDVSVMGADLKLLLGQESMKPRHTRLCVGGDAVNQSMTLSRLGHKVAFMGNVGDDDAGTCIQKVLAGQGIDLTALKIRKDCPTSTVVLLVGEKDEKHICPSTDESSNRKFDIDNVDFDLFQGVKAVSFSSMFCFPEMDDARLTAIFQKAKEAGAFTFADNKLNRKGSYDHYRSAMGYLDYLFLNQDEAEFYSGYKSPRDAAAFFLEMGVRHVIIKLGGDGCYIAGSGESHRIPAFDVEPVDTNGAGDNFAAGFISSVLDGKSFYDSAVFASAAAGLAVSVLGSSVGVRSKVQVEEFISRHRMK